MSQVCLNRKHLVRTSARPYENLLVLFYLSIIVSQGYSAVCPAGSSPQAEFEKISNSHPTGDEGAVSGCINHPEEAYNPEVCQQTCSDDPTCMGVFVYHADHSAAGRCCYKSSWTGMGTTPVGDFYVSSCTACQTGKFRRVEYEKIFDGECAGLEEVRFEGPNENPGKDTASRLQACANASGPRLAPRRVQYVHGGSVSRASLD